MYVLQPLGVLESLIELNFISEIPLIFWQKTEQMDQIIIYTKAAYRGLQVGSTYLEGHLHLLIHLWREFS